MPFKDGAFDFSFCAHVLEHVEDPAAAIREITRVSQRGYIEVPNGVFESMAPFRSHLWFVYYVEGRLLFVRKSKSMHDLFAANSRQIGEGGRLHEPFIRFPWSGQIDFEVVDDLPDTDRFAFRAGEEGDDTALPSGGYVAAVRVLRRAFHHRPSRSGR
jgi:SAM-dependent methyltransferase